MAKHEMEDIAMTVSVVLPTMNEAGNVKALCQKLCELRQGHPQITEAIFVLNNTTDGTDLVLENISREDRYRFVKTVQTKGARGSAIRKGVEVAQGEIVVVMDSDGQYDPRDIPKVIRPIVDQGCYITIGRNHTSANLLRRIISEGFKKLTKILLGVAWVQTGLKAGIRSVLLETVPQDVPGLDIDVRWANNIVTKGFGSKLSHDVKVAVYPRLHGRTTFHPIRLSLGLLYTTVSLSIERRTGRELPFPRILKRFTLYPIE